MKKVAAAISILLAVHRIACAVQPAADSSVVMWYETPANHFTQSLPLGNGRLGMMV
ncbi:MAG TPA: hypothetical protein ENI81_12560, partial [Phycisphaerales bacterium]|nr:hypothetical protein [Phycisphaerales bacterium]